MPRPAHEEARRGPDLALEHLDTVMRWLKRLAEVGLAVLIYRLIPALITAWQTAGAAAVTAAKRHHRSLDHGQRLGQRSGGQCR